MAALLHYLFRTVYGGLLRLTALAVALYCTTGTALAGNIFFNLTRSDTSLQVTNVGDSIAYYPQVFRLRSDGHWELLPLLPGRQAQTELQPKASLELAWKTEQGTGLIPATLPIMVRFFDQAGAGIGQISFFNQPMVTAEPLSASYENGWMVINPPQGIAENKNAIRSTWLIWAQEEGIGPLAGSIHFSHEHPPAQRLEWHAKSKPQRFQLGNGLPVAILLHETSRGFELQNIAGGGLRGKEQQAFWLGKEQRFYQMGIASGIAAFAVALFGMVAGWRRKQA